MQNLCKYRNTDTIPLGLPFPLPRDTKALGGGVATFARVRSRHVLAPSRWEEPGLVERHSEAVKQLEEVVVCPHEEEALHHRIQTLDTFVSLRICLSV